MKWQSSLVYSILLAVFAAQAWAPSSFAESLDATPRADEVYRDPATGMEFARVERGCFQMGSSPSCPLRFENEGPQNEVCVEDFWMGVYEVTQTQWESLMGSNPSQFKGPDLPVERVSWENVQEFVAKLSQQAGTGYRLPTEAEWEYAAKGGRRNQDFLFAGSNNLAEVAWYKENEGARTHAVGQKKPNELGLYDMSGNVWEWCQDWYENGYYGYRPKDNPQGPSQGYYRVVRGGSWCSDPRLAKSTARYRDAFYYVSSNLGFRLVFSPPKSLAVLDSSP